MKTEYKKQIAEFRKKFVTEYMSADFEGFETNESVDDNPEKIEKFLIDKLQERDNYWMNQKANDHDNKIREHRDSKWIEKIKEMELSVSEERCNEGCCVDIKVFDKNGNITHGVFHDEVDTYNQALEEILNKAI